MYISVNCALIRAYGENNKRVILVSGVGNFQRQKRIILRTVNLHHQVNGQEFEQTPGDSEGQGSLACQAPLSMEFSRQEYWSGLPFLSPRDLPDPGIELRSPALQADSLLSESPGKYNWQIHVKEHFGNCSHYWCFSLSWRFSQRPRFYEMTL